MKLSIATTIAIAIVGAVNSQEESKSFLRMLKKDRTATIDKCPDSGADMDSLCCTADGQIGYIYTNKEPKDVVDFGCKNSCHPCNGKAPKKLMAGFNDQCCPLDLQCSGFDDPADFVLDPAMAVAFPGSVCNV